MSKRTDRHTRSRPDRPRPEARSTCPSRKLRKATRCEWTDLIARSDLLASLARYGTTLDDCACPDRRFRKIRCKHMTLLRFAQQIVDTAAVNRAA